MSNSFHLALPAGDIETAEKFYTEVLGCKTGNREKGKWVDIDFWGNELTLHQTSMKLPRERHDVDMGDVPVPHFGVHLKKDVFEKIWISGGEVDETIQKEGLEQVTNFDEIESMIDKVIQSNPEQHSQYKAGKDRLFGFFVGQVMKASEGKANPKQVNDILKEKLEK